MKKFFLILICLSMADITLAQIHIYSSSIYDIEAVVPQNSRCVAKAYGTNDIVMNVRTTGMGPEVFIVRGKDANASNEFSMFRNLLPYGTIGFQIKDMCVLDNVCYFCGIRIRNIDLYDTVGIFGMFRIDSLAIGYGKYHYIEICPTSTLDRIDVYKVTDNDLRMAMVGKEKVDNRSCLVELRYALIPGGTYEWSGILEHPVNPHEVITDIASTNEYLYVVSQFDTSNTRIGIRYNKLANYGFYNSDFTYAHDIRLYNIRNMFCTPSLLGMQGVWKALDTPIYLCSVSNDQVIAAFPSANFLGLDGSGHETHSSFGNVILCKIGTSSMSEAMLVELGQNLSLLDMSYLPGSNSAVITTQSQYILWPSQTYSMFQFVKLGRSSSDGPYWDTIFYRTDGKIYSASVFDGLNAVIAGVSASNKSFSGIQNRHHHLEDSCCYVQTNLLGDLETRILSTAANTLVHSELKPSKSVQFTWSHIDASVNFRLKPNRCQHKFPPHIHKFPQY